MVMFIVYCSLENKMLGMYICICIFIEKLSFEGVIYVYFQYMNLFQKGMKG